MPGGKGRAARLLDEEGRGVDQDVGADQVLDDVEDTFVPHQRVEPGQKHIGSRAPAPVRLVDPLAEPDLVAGEAGIALGKLFTRQRREWKQVAVVPIALDLLPAQHPALRVSEEVY